MGPAEAEGERGQGERASPKEARQRKEGTRPKGAPSRPVEQQWLRAAGGLLRKSRVGGVGQKSRSGGGVVSAVEMKPPAPFLWVDEL